MEKTMFIKKKRLCAFIIVVIMILNMFSPYTILVQNVYAGQPADGEPYFKMTLLTPGDPDSDDDDATYYYYFDYLNGYVDTPEECESRAVLLQLSIEGCDSANGGDIYFKWDTSKMTAAQVTKPSRNGNPQLEEATDYTNSARYSEADFGTTEWGMAVIEELDASAGTLRFTGTISPGASYLTSGSVVGTFLFLLQDGVSIDDLTDADIELVTGATGLSEGLEITYFPDGKTLYVVDGKDYLIMDSFSESGEKSVDSIEISKVPSKTQYYIGENLDFTDGEITIKYDDGSDETMSIADAISNGKITANSTVATNNKKVTFKCDSETVDFEYYVLDSLSVASNLSKMNYEHGDTIDFTGGTLTASYKNSAGATTTATLNIADEITAGNLSVDRTVADVDNQTVTYTYYDGKTANMTLTVTDPIESISITTSPTNLTYSDGETINLEGGIITPITKSGKTGRTVATDSSSVTVSTTTASIAQAVNKWKISGDDGLEAGNQVITLTYEGKTADLNIVVNDTVSAVSITTQPTAKNKIGTASTAIDFSGLVATVSTSGGASFTVGPNSLTIDRSSYNSNSLSMQSLPAKYGTINSSNDVKITLSNYITGISVNFTKTEFEYGTALSTVLASGTYTENYADGTSSSSKTITSDMVTGYNASPNASLFTSSHTYGETLTITLSTSSNSFDVLPATATQAITIVDVIDNIEVKNKPNKTSYNYGDTFSSNGGQITVNYKSGNTATVSMGSAAVSLTETNGNAISMTPTSSEFTDGKATKTIKVTYTSGTQTFDTSFDITIKDEVSSIAVTKNPTLTFNHGDTFNANNGQLTVTYATGREEVVDLDEATLTETDDTTINMSPQIADYTNNLASKTIKVSYGGKDTTYSITIVNDVKSIEIHTTPKTSYNVNDSLDISSGEIEVKRAVGANEIISMTDTNVSVTGFSSATENTSLPLTVSYTENGITKQTTYNVEVKDSVTAISIKTTPKTSYKYNESLDVTGGELTVTKGSGNTTVSLESSMVSGYNPETLGEQELTITYGGQTAKYKVTVKDYVTGITLNPSSVTGDYGDTISDIISDNSIEYTVTYAKAGAQTAVALVDTMVSGYSATTTSAQSLTVKYIDSDTNSATNGTTFEATLNVTLNDTISSIIVKAPTSTQTYNYGGTLDLTGATITVNYASGATPKTVTPTTAMVFEQGTSDAVNMSPASSEFTSDNGNKVTKTVTLKYTEDGKTGSIDYPITIVNDVQSISVHSTNHKTNYNVNDSLDVTDLEILVTRAVGTPEAISVTSDMVTGFSSATENTSLPLTISYTENGITKQTTYNVSVKDTVSAISIKTTPKTSYKYNESLDVTGGELTVTKGSGNTTVSLESSMVSGYDPETLGEQELTITYGGQTAKYKVTVKDYVTGISVSPSSVTGDYGDTISDIISDNSIEYTVTYAKAGAQTAVALVDTMVSGYSATTTSAQSLTVKYTDNDTNSATNGTAFEATLNVTLNDTISSITVKAPTSTQTYNYGGTLDLTGATITVNYASGATQKTVTPTTAMVFEQGTSDAVNMSPASSEFTSDNGNKVTKTVTLKYTEDGKTGSIDYPITIVNDVQSISVHSTNHKTDYNVNDSLDVTNLEILVTRAVGTSEAISVTSDMVTGFNSTVENTSLPLTISYTENGITKQVSYNVAVKDSVTSISASGTPTEAKYNEELDLSGTTISVTKGSGNTSIPVTSSMISGYDKTTLGNQTVTITYGGKETTFVVTVKDYVTGISVSPSSVTGDYGDTLSSLISDNSIEYTVTYAKAGAQTAVALVDTMVSGYSATTTSAQSLTVKYTDSDTNSATNGTPFEATLNVTLNDTISSITVKAPTSTQTYNYGGTLDLTGATITVNYASGATPKTVTPTTAMVFEQGTSDAVNMSPASTEFTSDNGNKVTKTVTLKYTEGGKTGSIDYPITIVNDVQSISVHSTNHKTDYNVNDSLDVTNLEILVTRAVGSPEAISVTSDMVTGFNSTVENTSLPLTISYTENGITKQVSYNVSVKDSVTSISASGTPTEAKYNEELDLSGTTISVTKGSGNTSIPVTSSMISGYDKTTLGNQTVTITYGGKETTFVVTVKDYVTGISVSPSSVTGDYGDTLSSLISNNNIEYTVTYAKAGAQTAVALADTMVSGYSATTTSAQSLTVKYTDSDTNSATNGTPFEATLNVTLSNAITAITITPPTKATYNHGDSLDLTGGSIELTYADGTSGTEAITSATIKEADGSAVNMSPSASDYSNDNTLSKTLKIEYTKDGITGSVDYPITIVNDVQSISVHSTNHKTSYNVNDSLDVTDLEILVTRAVGSPEAISVTADMVTGFSSATENTSLPLTISYTENGITKQATYNVAVKDTVSAISIKTTPKTNYKYNESLDVTDGELTVTKGSGNTTVSLESSMVSGYDPETLGEQELTITYGGQTVKYKVTVKDYVTGISVSPSSVTGSYGNTLSSLISDNSIEYTVTYAKAGAQTAVALTDTMVSGYSATTTSAQSLTVKYTDNDANSATNGTTFEATLDVTLNDNVNSISITNVPTEVNYDEELDLSSAVITVTKDSGTITIPVSDVTVSGYDKTTLGNQTVTIAYGGKETTFNVEVKDYLKDIELVAPTQTEYHWSTTGTLDLTGGSVQTVMASGAKGTPVNLDDSTVTLSSFTPNVAGTQTIQVTYEGIVKTFDVSVIDEVSNISINNPPTQVDYGKDIDLSGTTITITKDSGVDTIPVTKDMLSNYDSTDLSGTQTVTVTYGGKTDTFNITVNDYVVDFVLTAPSKDTYEYGESLSISDGYLTKITASGANTETVALTESMISGYDSTKLGAQTVTVKYEGIEKTFGVRVEDNIQSIQMANTPKTTYNYGDSLDVTGGTITVTRSSGTTTLDITPSMVSGYDPNTVGSQTLTVTYSGKTTTYAVNVNDYIEKLSIVYPSKLVYNLNEGMDLAGGSVKVIMASGAVKETVSMDPSMISGFDTSSRGSKVLTVSYAGKNATFGIAVKDQLSNMNIETLPSKLEYLVKEGLDLTGGTISLTRNSGDTEIISMSDSRVAVTGFDSSSAGTKTLTVTVTYTENITYTKQNIENVTDEVTGEVTEVITEEEVVEPQTFTETDTFTVNVSDYESDAIIVTPTKTKYEYGEDLDLTGGSIKIMMASGAVKEEATLTSSMLVNEFNPEQAGVQTLTVTYKGYTKQFNVTVTDTVSGISLNNAPNKTNYKYGEGIDITGGSIKVTRTSGTSIIPITSSMISGYNPNVAGNQVITVTYEGKTTQFVVYVNPEEKTNDTPTTTVTTTTTPTPTPRRTTVKPVTEEVEEVEETPIEENTVTETPIEEEKPTITLGEKDEVGNVPESTDNNKLAKVMLLMACIILLLLLILRKNTKVYVVEDGEYALAGKLRLGKNDPEINVNDFLDGENYNNKVKIVLNDSISDKLDGKEITIKHRDRTFKVKVEYEDEPFEIILE